MQTYTSPHTGITYDVVPVEQSRTDYHVPGYGTTRYERHYTEYLFYRNGERVTWTYSLDEKHLSDTFGEIEGVYTPWTTSPWD